MIAITEQRRRFWRNPYSLRPALQVSLTFGPHAGWTLDAADPASVAALRARLANLVVAHSCGPAELMCAIAQALQRERDDCPGGMGVISRDGTSASLFFSCRDHVLAETAAMLALRLTNRLIARMPPGEYTRLIDLALARTDETGFDQSTRAMIAEAERRDIPWIRAHALGRHVLAGHGARQKMFRETLRSGESAIGRELARSKALTFAVLAPLGLPVGSATVVPDIARALEAAKRIGYPLVLKPVQGEKGRHVYAGLRNDDALRNAFVAARGAGPLLLQSFFAGEDHRLLVVDGRLVAAARRRPASVTGDGKRTIGELVAEANCDPRRGTGFSRLMNLIVADAEMDRVLALRGLECDSIPPEGDIVRLKTTANISTGGTADDVLSIIHPDNARAAVRAAKALDLRVAGVDFISPDIARSWHETGGGICEVNTVVGLRPHWLANPTQNVVAPIFDTIAPAGDDLRIPTAMITGSKGKTTTSLMLAGILTAAGHTSGVATTDGVRIADETIARGDYAGANGAAMVLRDPTVTAAVLETSRGGLLRGGTWLDRCDVGALLNVMAEQTGLDGIETLDQMMRLKSLVLDTATRAIVVNADDPLCCEAAALQNGKRVILFALDAKTVRAHTKAGGDAVVLAGDDIVHLRGRSRTPLLATAQMPSLMGGILRPNLVNALAAAALALAMDIAPDAIADGLGRFDTGFETTRGRFSMVDGFPFAVMFDRAKYPPAFASALPAIAAIPVNGKRICAVTMSGDRPDWNYAANAQLLAGCFERYICYERADRRRGRPPGEIAAALARALTEAGATAEAVSAVQSYEEAVERVAREAQSDDLVVIFAADPRHCIASLRAAVASA